MLTATRLRELLSYDPESGLFRWRVARRGRPAGALVGQNPTTCGYGMIRIDGAGYYSHRLAWLYVHGEWPTDQIDHANMNRVDNRIANLREASRQQNRMNERRRKNNTSGFKGVSWNAKKAKWEARVMLDRKNHLVGYFESSSAAHAAWKVKAAELHGEFARFS